jgi:predicted ATPase
LREGPGYRLAVDPEQVDAGRFARLVREAGSSEAPAALAAYEEALELWRGPPFGEFAFAEFAQLEIRRLEELHARAREGWARALVELGRHEEALPELRRLVDAEPTREQLGRTFALALYRSGRQVDALEALRALGAELLELGLEPSNETRKLERRILVHDPALALSSTTTPAPPTRAPRRLPAPASRFFGREAHLAHAGELLEELPLVTIAGVGGAGKTRLALELARRSADRFPDGRWLCELGPVDRADDVPGALTDALGVEPAAGDVGLDRPIEHLAARRGLLVLDNCEHVLDGAAAAVELLLAGCPALRILTTSRAPLGVEGEQVLRLAGLELPAGRRAPDAVESPAVALFIDRARAAGRPIDRESELGSVAEICRRLDGLPLAIELAAGRARSLTPAEIAAHLSERFSLLAVSGRRAAPRHTTLRAAIDWSYNLLEPGPQRLFERLSVFVRGATLDGARDACAGDGVERGDVAGLLDQLVAQSMVTAASIGAQTLYGMLESLRDYAAERLENRGEHQRLHDRHADHYTARARRLLEGQLTRGPALPFADEFDDVRAAVRWSLRTDSDHERAFTIVAPLWALAPARHAEQIALLAEEALERWPQEDPLRLQVLGTASTARLFLGDLEGARRHAELALALEQRVGETALMARRTLAHLALYSGDRDDAARQTQDVAARARAAGQDWLACECDGFAIQLLHAAGHGDAAIARAAEMRRDAERLDVPFMVCWSLYVSGVVHLDRDPQEARRRFMEAVALGREVGHHHMVRFSLRGLGVAALLDGDHVEAAQRLLAALAHDEEHSDAASQWATLAAIAPLLAGRDPELAAELLAASEAWPAGPMIRSLAERTHDRIADCLSAEQHAEAIARGQKHDLASAKASARSELDALLREPIESARP